MKGGVIMAKEKSKYIRSIKIKKPAAMEYYVDISNSKKRNSFIKRVERIVRGSMEYRDYIKFCKEHIGLDKCIFFKNVSSDKGKRKRISIELHHDPITLYDIVAAVLLRYEDEGRTINDLLIADEVIELHYANKVGLVPLSITAHQMVHSDVSTKLIIPINCIYGNYAEFLKEYEPYCEELHLFDKIEKRIAQTKKLTEKDFDAIKTQYTYIEVDGFEDVEKMQKDAVKKEVN